MARQQQSIPLLIQLVFSRLFQEMCASLLKRDETRFVELVYELLATNIPEEEIQEYLQEQLDENCPYSFIQSFIFGTNLREVFHYTKYSPFLFSEFIKLHESRLHLNELVPNLVQYLGLVSIYFDLYPEMIPVFWKYSRDVNNALYVYLSFQTPQTIMRHSGSILIDKRKLLESVLLNTENEELFTYLMNNMTNGFEVIEGLDVAFFWRPIIEKRRQQIFQKSSRKRRQYIR
jgi:hypothetical protein